MSFQKVRRKNKKPFSLAGYNEGYVDSRFWYASLKDNISILVYKRASFNGGNFGYFYPNDLEKSD